MATAATRRRFPHFAQASSSGGAAPAVLADRLPAVVVRAAEFTCRAEPGFLLRHQGERAPAGSPGSGRPRRASPAGPHGAGSVPPIRPSWLIAQQCTTLGAEAQSERPASAVSRPGMRDCHALAMQAQALGLPLVR